MSDCDIEGLDDEPHFTDEPENLEEDTFDPGPLQSESSNQIRTQSEVKVESLVTNMDKNYRVNDHNSWAQNTPDVSTLV